jgi:hypothetical protein
MSHPQRSSARTASRRHQDGWCPFLTLSVAALMLLSAQTAHAGAGTTGGVCYVGADSVDELEVFDLIDGTFTDLGPTGTVDLEAIAYQPGTDVLFGADADTLGRLDQSTGAFTPVAGTFGTCTLPDTTIIAITDVDGLAFDPFTGILWGAHRRGSADDVLVTIDPLTGQAAATCVVIASTAAVALGDIDDLAVSPATGAMYAIANNGGAGDRLVMIDTTTGAVTDIAPTTLGGSGLSDVEGLGFANDGTLLATTGSASGTNSDRLYVLDQGTAVAVLQGVLYRSGPPVLNDHEAVDCLTAGANRVLGTVFADPNGNGTFDGGESGQGGVVVWLYVDDGDGIFEPSEDRLIQTAASGPGGAYSFAVGAQGTFWVSTDFPGSYPPGSALTTDNVESAVFAGFNQVDSGNDFGFAIPNALVLTKISSASPGNVSQGSVITYTLEPRSMGLQLLSNVEVVDSIPIGSSFLGAAPAQTSGPDPLQWDLGTVTPPADGSASSSGTLILTALKDAYLNEERTDRNYGSCTTIFTDRESGKRLRSLLEFDLSGLPAGAIVTSAELTMVKVAGSNDGNPVAAHRVTRQWQEGTLCDAAGQASWLNASPGVSWTTPGGDFAPTAADTIAVTVNQAYTWNVTSIAQAWATGASNFGLMLKPQPESDGGDKKQEWASRQNATVANRPQLVVNYMTPVRTTQLRASGSVVTAGDPITVTMTLRSASVQTDILPGALTVIPASADAINCGTPLLTSANDDLDGTPSDAVTFQWTCQAVAGLVGGSVTFSASATSTTLAFPSGTSNSVLVSPPLTFQVQVANPIDPAITAIVNTGVLTSDQSVPATDMVSDPVVSGAIGDRVWLDSDADGVQDPGEDGLESVELTLYLDDDGIPGPSAGDSVVATTLSGPNGGYSFDFLAPGAYYTQVTGGLAPDLVLSMGSTNPSALRTIREGEPDAFDDLDFGFRALSFDWGDLPDGPYATLAASNGPSHEFGGFENVLLGSQIDAEANGQSSVDGEGDDGDAQGDDDDGITFLSPILAGSEIDIEVFASATSGSAGDGVGILNAWIDFNSDGDFDDPGEWIATDLDLASGVNLLAGIPVPADATGSMAARFRITNAVGQGGDSPTGPAATGEVEDTVLAAIGGSVWNDSDGDGVQDAGEPPVAGVTVHLVAPDGFTFVVDGAGDPITATTDANGEYQFYGLPTADNSGLPDPGQYRVLFDRPAAFADFSPQDVGSDDTIDSDADPDNLGTGTEGLTAVYLVLAGRADGTVDAGLRAVTAALITSARAFVDGSTVVFEFSTGYEALSAGFDVYRYDPETGVQTPVTEAPVPALVGAPQGGVYRVEDRAASRAKTPSYTIVEHQADGRTQIYGPLAVELAYEGSRGARHQGVAARAHVSPRLAHRLAVGAAERAQRQGPTRAFGESGRARNSDADATVQFDIYATGLYYVTASELAVASGLPEGKLRRMISGGDMSLAHLGRQAAWMAADGEGSGFYFYGEAIDSLYTLASPYRAVFGEQGVVMGRSDADGAGPRPGGTFTSVVPFEVDRIAAVNSTFETEVDHWYWDGINAGSSNNRRSFEVAVIDAAPGAAALTARFAGATNGSAGDDHFAIVRVNGVEVGTVAWNGLTRVEPRFELDGSLLTPMTSIEVEGILVGGSTGSIFFIDGFDLEYPRSYRASDEGLLVTADGNADITVDGFSTADIVVLEVKDSQLPRVVTGARVTSGASGFQVSFTPSDDAVPYYATTRSAAHQAGNYRKVVADHDLGAAYHAYDHLVIAPAQWMTEAEELAAFHSSRALRSLAVSAEEIYDTFGNGVPTPWAIRDFLRHTRTWETAPEFVVLIGRGTLDPRNLLGGGDNFLPVVQVGTSFGLVPSDNALADLRGDDGIPEVAIGRLPVVSGAEVESYVAKLEARDLAQGEWRGRALLLADNPDAAGDFSEQSKELASHLRGYEVSDIDLEDMTVEQARTALADAWNAGARLVNYIGHGGVTQFAGEGLLRTSDMGLLANDERLPVVSALTCVIGRSDIPNLESLAEALVTDGDGGAIAVWSSSGLSLSGAAHELNLLYIDALQAGGDKPIGSAIRRALRRFGAAGGALDMLNGYGITGDPGVKP